MNIERHKPTIKLHSIKVVLLMDNVIVEPICNSNPFGIFLIFMKCYFIMSVEYYKNGAVVKIY